MASAFDLAESVRSVHAALRDELRKGLRFYVSENNIYIHTIVHKAFYEMKSVII